MKIIIVGLGSIGKYYLDLIPKISKKNDIFVIDKIKFKKNKKFKQVSFSEILKKKIFFNFAIICTPSGLHFKHANFFLKIKSNVLIEKPFALRLDDAKKLVRIAKKNKVKCWTSLQNRYNLATKKSFIFKRDRYNE